MKVLYISTPAYADCDFPLVKAYQDKGIDITYIITIGPFNRKSTLINIDNPELKTGIYSAFEMPELAVYKNYMDLRKVFITYRTGRNILSPSTWIENYKLRKFVNKSKFDIIHTDDYYKGMRNWIYETGAKIIVSHHDPFPHSGEHFKNEVAVYNHVIRNSNGSVLLNKKQLSEFCDFYHIAPQTVLINSLGVYDNIRSFIKELPENGIKNNILFFGRISQYKGIEYLCEAIKKVHRMMPEITLTIAGGGSLYFDFEPYKDLEYIKLINRYVDMEELASLLSASDITVCPYTDATQSGVIMTSYSLGKPVIATNVGGLPEMVDNGKTGILIPPRDSDALADAILSLYKEENKINEMSQYILSEYYKGEKSWSHIADTYIDYYKNILKNENKE